MRSGHAMFAMGLLILEKATRWPYPAQRRVPAIRDVFAHAPPRGSKINPVCTSQKPKIPQC